MQPDAFTIQELMLDVGDGHTLYVQDWGSKAAHNPIIVLHGGPGSGSKDSHKRTFDPKISRVIFFDQRGSGNSIPYGSLDQNTTDTLVADISKVADTLQLDTFVLFGNSWGSTLALTYALAHPERVSALVVAGIYTDSKDETSWVDAGEFNRFYPDVWAAYLE